MGVNSRLVDEEEERGSEITDSMLWESTLDDERGMGMLADLDCVAIAAEERAAE